MAIHSLALGGTVAPCCRGGAITIGNFDGVHRGHQGILAALKQQAQSMGGPAVAVTFDPHPLQLLRPSLFQPLLTTPEHRAELLLRYGADQVVILNTTPELLQLDAREFFEEMIQARLGARSIVEGPNFGFGRNREGNVDTLRAFGAEAGVAVVVVPPVEWEGRPISSSRVRADLVAGAVAHAASLLGAPFRVAGRVGTGQKRGQTLGFPTANLEGIRTLIPGDGVYAVRAATARETWPGAANVGPNPTFGEHARKVEVHLIGFGGDLYGQDLAVDFVERLRDTRPFAGPAELMDQLRRDVAAAKAVLRA
jgi:riboflavin kinase/FMN adenylyltransferase